MFLEILGDARAMQANKGANNKYDVNNKDDARAMQANEGANNKYLQKNSIVDNWKKLFLNT